MSHFTVTVLGDDYQRILAPYDESIQVNPYIHTPAYQVKNTFFKIQGKIIAENLPTDLLTESQKQTLSLKTPSSEWWDWWCGEQLDERGNGLSRYNKHSKWDWYSLGGRWIGLLPLKKGKKGELGMPGVFGTLPKTGTVDRCKIGDVDWERVHKEAQVSAGEEWDRLFEPYDPKTCYYNQQYVEKQKGLHMQLYKNRDDFIRRRGYWRTYALLSEETGWLAPGRIIGFGASTDNTDDREAFDKLFVKTLKSFPKSTVINVVDCHI